MLLEAREVAGFARYKQSKTDDDEISASDKMLETQNKEGRWKGNKQLFPNLWEDVGYFSFFYFIT